MRQDLAELTSDALDSTCTARAGTVLATAHYRTGFAAIVDISAGDEPVIAQTLRIVTERRARQSLGWPKGQRIFAPREVEICLTTHEHITRAREALTEINADDTI
jgi:hypothetical protein